MPNWCENNLTIEGPEDCIADLLVRITRGLGSEEIDFARITPESKNHEMTEVTDLVDGVPICYQVNEWYYDHINRWGTKWNACDCYIGDRRDGHVEFCFETAWNPPSGYYDILAKFIEDEYPGAEVVFYTYFIEPGCCFEGSGEGTDGEYTEESHDLPDDSDECDEECDEE